MRRVDVSAALRPSRGRATACSEGDGERVRELFSIAIANSCAGCRSAESDFCSRAECDGPPSEHTAHT